MLFQFKTKPLIYEIDLEENEVPRVDQQLWERYMVEANWME